MGVLAAVAVGGCGGCRSERTRVLPPLGAPGAPSVPSFLLSGEESAGAEVRACPGWLRERSQPGSSAQSHLKCGAIGAVLGDRKVLKGK